MAQELWQYANPIGRPPRFKKPKELWDKFCEYAQAMNDSPIKVSQRSKKSDKNESTKKSDAKEAYIEMAQHPLTLEGFCLFANISAWREFKKSKAYQTADFLAVINAIEGTIREHQISGAMAGAYNANLTARLNGISEKTEVSGKDGGAIAVAEMSQEDINAEVKRIAQSILND